ncbi:hypothetical protein B0H66DRAFT_526897 [Apodospora peruviana]|uniref:Helix-turn-helix domain-containing protein n=1 Tax=Apodospora peruviana TaxID=516989 RepID=A0AAE0IQY1_9PEZI|nr:hypothetical protein B0H66DRAFT_526897 [Apodospora peruviana]
MGASGSKAASKVVRKYPTRAPGVAPPTATSTTARASRPPPPEASLTKDEAIRADSVDPEQARPDPDFASRLHQMGIAQPNPTWSPSSIASPGRGADITPNPREFSAPQFPPASQNITLGVLEARRQLEQRAQQEFENMGKSGYQGREFLDIATIRNILVLREGRESPAAIEARLRLKPGVVARLGPSGILSPAS